MLTLVCTKIIEGKFGGVEGGIKVNIFSEFVEFTKCVFICPEMKYLCRKLLCPQHIPTAKINPCFNAQF